MKQIQTLWLDDSGREALNLVYVPDDVDSLADARVVALLDAMAALSTAHLYAAQLVVTEAREGAPAAGPFDCLDYIYLRFPGSVTNTRALVFIPAPLDSVLVADRVDLEADLVEDLVAAAEGFILTPEGLEVSAPTKGLRGRYDS